VLSALASGIALGVIFVDQNNIQEIPNASPITLAGTNGAGGANFKMTNNTMPKPTGTNFNVGCGSLAPCPTNTVDIQSLNGNTVCAIVTGNSAYDPESWSQGAGSSAFFLFQTGSTLNLEGSGSATSYIAANNTVTDSSGSTADAPPPASPS